MVLVLAVIGLATPSTASAQVGVLVGLNMANVNFDTEGSSFDVNGDRRTGFVAGLAFNLPIQDIFSVEVDALFAQKGAKFNLSAGSLRDTVDVKLDYVDVPVMGRINLPGSGPVRVHLLLGPSFNFKIREKFEQDGLEIDDDEDGVEGVETALVFGGGVHMGAFRVDLRYGIGLSNIIKESDLEGFTGKNRVFSILVGFGG